MTRTRRGIGVVGALDHAIVREVAPEIEQLGYSTFWANDTPGGDGLASLAAAAAVTATIRLGVGVIAVDRVPASAIIARINELDLPRDRLIIGIGSGGMRKGSLDIVRTNANVLHEAGIPVVVGALGPKMIALSGEVADGALLNWLTPAAAARSTELLHNAAGERPFEAIAYVRTAIDDDALAKLESEALRYEAFPQYGDHFERMGVRAIDTCVTGPTVAAVQAGLAGFDGMLDEVVARAIVAEESTEDYLALIRAAAPEGSRRS